MNYPSDIAIINGIVEFINTNKDANRLVGAEAIASTGDMAEPYCVVYLADSDGNKVESMGGIEETLNLEIRVLVTLKTTVSKEGIVEEIKQVYYAVDEIKRLVYSLEFLELLKTVSGASSTGRINSFTRKYGIMKIGDKEYRDATLTVPFTHRFKQQNI